MTPGTRPATGHRAIVAVALAAVARRTPEGAVEMLLTRRSPEVDLGGMWELPGGKMEVGETAVEAAQRELLEEVGITMKEAVLLAEVEHEYPQRAVRLSVVAGLLAGDGAVRLNGPVDAAWVGVAGLDEYTLPPANSLLIPALRAWMRSLEAGAGGHGFGGGSLT